MGVLKFLDDRVGEINATETGRTTGGRRSKTENTSKNKSDGICLGVIVQRRGIERGPMGPWPKIGPGPKIGPAPIFV